MPPHPLRQPALFIPHGGGPCFFMDDPDGIWTGMGAYLRGIPGRLPEKPRAILVISAHWEEAAATVQSTPSPGLIFDYYGFPEHTYRLTYPAPGAPGLADRVTELTAAAGIASAQDGERGYDHGVFIPLKVMFPDADIPVAQLSLRHDLDPLHHSRLGRALEPLRDEGVLIVGSGLSYHNLRAFFGPGGIKPQAKAFDDWLADAVAQAAPDARAEALARWADAPGGRFCHPREEHLLPLMVASGAGGNDPGRRTYGEIVMGNAVSAFEFG